MSTGIPNVDAAIEGCPRGRITEIVGPCSSGRTTLLHSILAAATTHGEFCVLVDTRDAFDPATAAAAGVELEKLIWIRCGANVEHALRAADMVLASGGFGVVALDLADVSPATLRRIPLTTWFRFRRAIEPTPAVLLVIANQPQTKSCASLLLETRRRRAAFLRGVDYELTPRKPTGREHVVFHVCLHSLSTG